MKTNFHLLTRPKADSLAMQQRLEWLQIKTIISPLLKIVFYPKIVEEIFAKETLVNCAIITTSANSLRCMGLCEIEIPKNLDLLVTGEVSYREALTMQFKNVRKIGDKSQDILDYFSEQKPKYHKIYHLSGDRVTLNLEELLKKQGFLVERYVVYDSRPQILTEETLYLFKNSRIYSVSLFSSYSAEVFCQQIKEHSLEEEMINLKLFTISEEIARIIEGKFLSRKVFISDSHRGEDMVKLILEQHS